jgi:3-hydroxyisobutyrate dehydrogenase-like beta-hydroxyacid dehydrogenase
MGEPSSVGFVGLGALGRPMASRLLDVPGGLTVFDARPERAAGLVVRGARVAGSVGHLGELCDLVCIRVPDDRQVAAVVLELLESARPGTTLMLHATMRPHTAVQLAERAARADVHLLDAAVVGPPSAAEQGRLALLVGGDESRAAWCLPVLERMADQVLHVGEVGSGIRAKAAAKLVQYVAFVAAAEGARLAEASGISPAVLGHIVRHSDSVMGGPGTVLWRDTTAPMTEDDPWRDVFTRLLVHGERELYLSLELADQVGVDTPLAELAVRSLAPALGFAEAGRPRHAVLRRRAAGET